MSGVNYSCRHPIAIGSRAGGPDNRDKALRFFFALRFPTDSYRYKLGMTTVRVEAYKTVCCVNNVNGSTAKDLKAMES